MRKNGLRWLIVLSLALGYILGRKAAGPKSGPVR
jgi:hypothetical protein